MFINFVPGEECRIAIVEDGRLEEFYHERASAESHVGNIYKGKVTNVEPAIQAAFVDFGLERNGFLHTTDLHPKYFPGNDREEFENVGHKTARRDRPPIQRCLKRGDEVMVQVLKEGIGTKGPTVTSYLSIPGRFLVMMPDMKRLGVSRKNEDDEQRKQTRDLLKELNPPEDFGFIVRTAGVGQPKTDLKRDLAYLTRLWKRIEQRRKQLGKKVGELYTEQDLIIRTIRDVFTADIERIVFDDLEAAQRASEFLSIASPRHKTKVVYYEDPVPLFHRMGIEKQIECIGAREVPLPSGGQLVIDSTEALVAIDVNSGKSRDARDAETNALRTNEEAVDEIARRLRDLGGIVVLDLIDMLAAKHRKQVENRFKNHLKNDRARTRVGGISAFGLLEMTRQRMRADIKKAVYMTCPHCEGRGYTKSVESVVLAVMRRLSLVMHRPEVDRIELTISPDVAFHVLNRKRGELSKLEDKYGTKVLVRVGGSAVDFVNVAAFDQRGVVITADLESDERSITPITDTSYREIERNAVIDLDDDDEQDTRGRTPTRSDDDAEEPTEAAQRSVSRSSDASKDDSDDDAASQEAHQAGEETGTAGGKKRRRRRRGRGRGEDARGDETMGDQAPADSIDGRADERARQARADQDDQRDGPVVESTDPQPEHEEQQDHANGPQEFNADGTKKKRRRRRRRRRGGGGDGSSADAVNPLTYGEASDEPLQATDASASPIDPGDEERSDEDMRDDEERGDASGDHSDAAGTAELSEGNGSGDAPKKRRRRRRRGQGGGSSGGEALIDGNAASSEVRDNRPRDASQRETRSATVVVPPATRPRLVLKPGAKPFPIRRDIAGLESHGNALPQDLVVRESRDAREAASSATPSRGYHNRVLKGESASTAQRPEPGNAKTADEDVQP